MPRFLVIDAASAPIAGVEAFVEPAHAPKNYVDPVKIAEFVAEKTAERVQSAALDLDLARITMLGLVEDGSEKIFGCRTEDDERYALGCMADRLNDDRAKIVTYGGFNFDLPLLMRRARYLGVRFPKLNLDRYRSPHSDLLFDLSDRDTRRMRPLGFYVRRLGWTDLVKPLTGEEESRVQQTGAWDLLEQSVHHDLEATRRLAVWLGVIPEVQQSPLVAASDARRGTP